MSERIEWIPSYAVNRPDLDTQHKELFRLIGDLSGDLDAKQVKTSIFYLFKYTRIHFVTEEFLLMETGYPEFKSHKRLHEELLSRLSEFADMDFHDEPSVLEFKEFANEWLSSRSRPELGRQRFHVSLDHNQAIFAHKK